MGFSRQEYRSGLPFPSPGDLPDPGIELWSPILQEDSLQTELGGKPKLMLFEQILDTKRFANVTRFVRQFLFFSCYREGSSHDGSKVKSKLLSRVQLFVTPWTVVCQTSLAMEFFRPEYWCGYPFPSPGDFPNPGIKPRSPALRADSLLSEPLCLLGHYKNGLSQVSKRKELISKVPNMLLGYSA